MNKSCATMKCQGIVTQRGNIYCDGCNEVRKQQRSKHERDVDDMMARNKELVVENARLKDEVQNFKIYSEQLEKKVQKLNEMLAEKARDNDRLEHEKAVIQASLMQLKLDGESKK